MKTLILGFLLALSLAACGHEQPVEQEPHCRTFYDNGQC